MSYNYMTNENTHHDIEMRTDTEITKKIEQQIEESLPCCEGEKPSKKMKPFWKRFEKEHFLGVCILLGALVVSGTLFYTRQSQNSGPKVADAKTIAKLEKVVLPSDGVILPVKWGDLGSQLVKNGTIDQKKFEELYAQRGGLDDNAKKLLVGADNGKLVINSDNANLVLNLLWALGLANKNVILEQGPMGDKQYGGAGNFASTGGWTLAAGNPMNHYSKHTMIPLTPEQQALIERTSQNIYRPCCGNSTYFPDCNHGMAMLGLLELMASQGVGEEEMYKAALVVNSFWFPDTYMTIAQYLNSKGIDWQKTGAKELLGASFSSASGYQQIKSQVVPTEPKSGSSCGA